MNSRVDGRVAVLAAVVACVWGAAFGCSAGSGVARSLNGNAAGASGGEPVGGVAAGSGGAAPVGGVSGAAQAGSDLNVGPCMPCSDFPADPLLDPQVSGTVPASFASAMTAATTTALCVSEPEPNSLLPTNWLRPRVKFTAPYNAELYEFRFEVKNQAHPLLAYTTQPSWVMPKSIWERLTVSSAGERVDVKVRSASHGGAGAGAGGGAGGGAGALVINGEGSTYFTIAPVPTTGSVVYWTSENQSSLKGFSIGDEGVSLVLRPSEASTTTQTTHCVGCHTATPDGKFLGFASSADVYNGDTSSIGLRSGAPALAEPDYATPVALALLARERQSVPTFSEGHWATGDRMVVNMFQGGLIWTDLEATSDAEGTGWGTLARTSDAGLAGHATFTHQGDAIVYVSSKDVTDSGIVGRGDLRVIPWNARKGGESKELVGAADPLKNEFYPAISPDDRFVSFTSVPIVDPTSMPTKKELSYDNLQAEISVVSFPAGGPKRLAINDPPACSMQHSPGINNAWAKWGPKVSLVGARSYYWLVFSSRRAGAKPQLYMTALTEEGGVLSEYGAVYLWNQPPAEGNHTPAWTTFEVPDPEVPR